MNDSQHNVPHPEPEGDWPKGLQERLAAAIFCNWFAGDDTLDPEAWDRLGLKDPWLKLAGKVIEVIPSSSLEARERDVGRLVEATRGFLDGWYEFGDIGDPDVTYGAMSARVRALDEAFAPFQHPTDDDPEET